MMPWSRNNNELRRHKKLRETQNQLIESQRLAAIAEVVSTICHEINNPLTAIMVPLQSRLRHDLPENYRKDFEDWLAMPREYPLSLETVRIRGSKTTSAGGEFKMIDLSLEKNISSGENKDR